MKPESKYQEPPKRGMMILRLLCDDRFLEEIEGDIFEWYYEEVEQKGQKRANQAFWMQLLSYLRLYFLRKRAHSSAIITKGMFKNYFKTFTRNFKKYRAYSFLNLLGLAIGFAAFLLIFIYINYQHSFENFHSKAERIFRPTYFYTNGEGFKNHFARVPVNYINELPEQMPEVEQLIRFQNQDKKFMRVGNEKFKAKHAFTTDANVFDVFDFPLVKGNPAEALASPFSVVITEEIAKKYFGDGDPMGQEIQVVNIFNSEEQSYQVQGVMQDLPSNTHLPIDMLFSFRDESERRGWAYIYALLAEGSTMEEVNAKMPAFVESFTDDDVIVRTGFELQALEDIHLHSDLARELKTNGNAGNVRIFFWVGIFILCIALLNFINLSSALSIRRAKEIGVRKILGARKGHNILYAFIESTSYSILALFIGILVIFLLFPRFGSLTEIEYNIPWQTSIPLIIGLALGAGFLSGLYPAFILNNLNLNQVIKSSKNLQVSNYSFNVKRALVGIQFCAAIILIGGALIGHRQVQYLQNKDLGIAQDQIISIADVPDAVTANYRSFKESVNSIPGVKQVAACMQVPSEEIRDSGPVLVPGENEDPEKAPLMDMQVIDADFIDLMQMELVAGNVPTQEFILKPIPEFSEEYSFLDYLLEQKRSYLINETGMKQLGWDNPEEAVGKQIQWSIAGLQLAQGKLSGIVKDFHQESLKNTIDPMLMVFEPIWLRSFLIKVDDADLNASIRAINQSWNEYFPKFPFEYQFLDDRFDQLYKSEQVQMSLLNGFSLLSIFIAALGLFGLIAFSLRMRIKEIAIRKVLGASLNSLVRLISKEYLILVIISALIAIPLSYYGMQNWLQNFAYRTSITPWSYLLTISLILIVLIIIISIQTYWSNRSNPTQYLKED